ncbi:efflux RND transporter permease subunit, partial [Mycobacterium tuberculosis]|nr:efflux RND transporter permease subunit [Mycobacterium tuberculosis]
FIVVQNSLSFNAPQTTVTIDRDRAAALGVPVSDIGQTLGLLVGGGKIAKFDRDSNSYDIIPQVPQDFRSNPENLGQYFAKSAPGDLVPIW